MNNIKDKTKKNTVNEYIRMVQTSINRIETNNEFISPKLLSYINKLKENIKMAPFKLGYLENN